MYTLKMIEKIKNICVTVCTCVCVCVHTVYRVKIGKEEGTCQDTFLKQRTIWEAHKVRKESHSTAQ